MLFILKLIGIWAVIWFIHSCEIPTGFDGVINQENPTEPQSHLLSNPVLPKLSSPMVWGDHYWTIPGDSLIPGKKDTTEMCRVYLDTATLDTAINKDGNQNGIQYPVSRTSPAVDYIEPYYYNPGNFYEVPVYRPLYQNKEMYENLLGKAIDFDLENPGKISSKGKYQFVGEINKGVHVFDLSSPSNPQYIAFWYIPGNIDIAIKNNTLYANSFSKLVALDISNPLSPRVKKILSNAFPQVYNYGHPMFDSTGGLLAAIQIDTMVHCGEPYYYFEDVVVMAEQQPSGNVQTDRETNDTFSKSGSMSRFAINSQYLYAVDKNNLNLIDISEEANPEDKGEILVGWGLETIFQTENALFIGARNGMHLFELSETSMPVFASSYQHVTSCDPVVVEGNYAFVTLSSGSFCRRGSNQLDIINISDLKNPSLINTFPMENPQGLAVADSLIFIAEGDSGLKVFKLHVLDKDANIGFSITLLDHKSGFHAYDVLVQGTIVSVIGNNGVYVYDFSDPQNLELKSHTESTGEGSGFDDPGFIFREREIFIQPLQVEG